jgi:hypothetical protein
MEQFYNPETFNQDKYEKSSWTISLTEIEGKLRLIVRVATGRKYWCLFSEIVNFELGIYDPALVEIKYSLGYYTFPLIDRFINELNTVLSDLYKVEINLYNIPSHPKKEGSYSSHNF